VLDAGNWLIGRLKKVEKAKTVEKEVTAGKSINLLVCYLVLRIKFLSFVSDFDIRYSDFI